jgi:hypothetical protein
MGKPATLCHMYIKRQVFVLEFGCGASIIEQIDLVVSNYNGLTGKEITSYKVQSTLQIG